MTDDEFEPRENDHLVEPMFAGLGVQEQKPSRTTWRGAILDWLRALWRRVFRSR